MNINSSYTNNTNNILTSALSYIQNKTEIREDNFQPQINKESIIFTQSYGSEFGFRTDSEGFFEQDFNMQAGLPFSYKINIKSIENIAKELLKQDEDLSIKKLDITGLVNTYFNALKSIEKEFSTQANEYLSRSEISRLNQGFSTESGEFSDELMKIYESMKEMKELRSLNKNLNTLNLGIKIFDFGFEDAIYNNSNNELLKPYMNENGDISKSGLLMNFIHSNLSTENEANFFIEPIKLGLDSHKNLRKMLEKESLFQAYIKDQNSSNMSFDLYLYVNGVNKQNTSKQKLENLYSQYLSKQRDVNIKDFVNSSSIFSLYTQLLNEDFSSLKNSLANTDKESLQSISADIKGLNEAFLRQREKQANFNRVIKSYLSIMQ